MRMKMKAAQGCYHVSLILSLHDKKLDVGVKLDDKVNNKCVDRQ